MESKKSFKRSNRDIILHSILFMIYGFVKYFPSPIGDVLRYLALKPFFKTLQSTCIKEGATFYMPYRISIGKNCSINEWVWIDGAGGIFIGDWVRIGHRTSIISGDHKFENISEEIKKQGSVIAQITIHNNVWIGANVTILKGVTINTGAVIAAGAVVATDIPGNAIAAGVPAKIIRNRNEK